MFKDWINKDFKRDWQIQTGGLVNVIETEHFAIDIDRDFIGLDFTFSWHFKMMNIQILNIVFKIY